MLHAPRLAAEWPAIVAALVVSTAAAIAVTGSIADRPLAARRPRGGGPRVTTRLTDIWVYLAQTPLLWLALTVVVTSPRTRSTAGPGGTPPPTRCSSRCRSSSPSSPSSGTSYRAYFEGAQFVHFLLGPATVALAVPLHRELRRGPGARGAARPRARRRVHRPRW